MGSGLSHGSLTTHTTQRLVSVYSTRAKNSEISWRNVDHCNDILDNRIILPLQSYKHFQNRVGHNITKPQK